MNYRADSPHCYTLRMLQDAIDFRDAIKRLAQTEGAKWPIRYIVMASKKPNVFSLGGDLATFVSCIRNNDRDSLLTYAYACIEVMYTLASAFDLPVLTLSVVRGQCMGGGFEGALATDFVIAEESARLGVPEIAFNTFPGMGAVTFLTRRVGPARTQQILSAGRVYSARELFDLDIIDVVAPEGRALETAHEWMLDPDGAQRVWRSGGFCTLRGARFTARGVDPNRNFPFVALSGRGAWNTGRNRPGSAYYRGPHPLSEPECLAVARLAERERFCGAVNFHSFGGVVYLPAAEGSAEARHALAAFQGPFQSRQRFLRYRPVPERSAAITGQLDAFLLGAFGTPSATIEVSRPGLLPPTSGVSAGAGTPSQARRTRRRLTRPT